MSDAIRTAGGPRYAVGSMADTLYDASGTTADFAKSLGIKYTYLMELTNTWYGFALPHSYINHTALPLMEGFWVFAEEVQRFAKVRPSSATLPPASTATTGGNGAGKGG